MDAPASDVPPLQVGEVVIYGEGKTGTLTRAYPMEDKYAVKAFGAMSEVKGPGGSFFYFKMADLQRAHPLPTPQPSMEPPLKQQKIEAEAAPVAATPAPGTQPRTDGRLDGRIKWFSKEKGFGKIVPAFPPPGQEEVFVHRSQMEGGPEGPHAQAISEGSLVSFEITTHIDGKPCACNVQVEGLVRALASIDTPETIKYKSDLVRRLLQSGLQVGLFQVKGVGKPSMEDRFISRTGIPVQSLGASCQNALTSLFGVFDGHSGASCSDFVSTNLDRSLFDCLRHQSKREVSSELAMRSALLAAFRMTEHNYFQYMNKLDAGAQAAWGMAGSTACTAALFGPDEQGQLRLAVANAGDSRVVLGKKDGRCMRLSEDHTPDVPSERKRIEQQGSAVVNANGIWRIVLPSRRGTGVAGLSVARGFGDLEYKQPAGVVSAVPDVNLLTVDLREDCFVVFGSDGIWGSVSDSEAVRIISSGLRESAEDPVRYAAQILVETAHSRDGSDDKTVLVVWFGDLPAAPTEKVSQPVQRMQAPVRMPAGRPPPVAAHSDDMFAATASRPMKAQSELSQLDDLFASYAREMGPQ